MIVRPELRDMLYKTVGGSDEFTTDYEWIFTRADREWHVRMETQKHHPDIITDINLFEVIYARDPQEPPSAANWSECEKPNGSYVLYTIEHVKRWLVKEMLMRDAE